jgi:hypothetical protein
MSANTDAPRAKYTPSPIVNVCATKETTTYAIFKVFPNFLKILFKLKRHGLRRCFQKKDDAEVGFAAGIANGRRLEGVLAGYWAVPTGARLRFG